MKGSILKSGAISSGWSMLSADGFPCAGLSQIYFRGPAGTLSVAVFDADVSPAWRCIQ